MTRLPGEPDLESGYPSPTIVDSRRLMGPNLMHAGLGAVLDVSLDDATPERNAALLIEWHLHVSYFADVLWWPGAETVQRIYPGGASLFVQAPIDQLMTATEVTEAAWVLAEIADKDACYTRMTALTASVLDFGLAERSYDYRAPHARRKLLELWNEAQRLGLNCTFDETSAFVGTGVGAKGWPLGAIPAVEAIDWLSVRDIPIVLVTGSNGKTTVVRMVAAMAKAAGHTVGYTCTDGVWINGAAVESGDWSGPSGARRVLQDPAVTFAVLETARGGILRRGLAVQRASVAAIVTLSPDHFGVYGITDLATLAEAKLVVGHAVAETGTLVYNAEISELAAAVARHPGRTASVSVKPNGHDVGATSQSRHSATRSQSEPETSVAVPSLLPCAFAVSSSKDLGMTAEELAAIPATLGGTAIHNVLNAAIALTIATELKLGPKAVEALKSFGADPRDNMGRLMLQTVGGITVVVDYAHNPQSVAALIAATQALPAARRAISLGTGGDRDDVALQQIAKAAFDSGVIDLYIAKEMPKFLRGRPVGSISSTLLAALRALGAPESSLRSAPSDLAAAREALQWAHEGDLLLLGIHDQRDEVLALLAELARINWHAGESLPA